MFALPFDEIAPIVGRSPEAASSWPAGPAAGSAAAPAPGRRPGRQREVVDAFLAAAARDGISSALLSVLDPDVVLRIDLSALSAGGLREVRGAARAVSLAASYRSAAPFAHPAMVSGSAGILITADDGQATSVMAFTFAAGKITEIYILADPSRLTQLTSRSAERPFR